jgi:transcriptional regulator with XRE-family HTH domain
VFGEQVRKYRQRLGLSQEDLGHEAAIDPKTIRGIETGRRTPRASTVRQLADALGLSGQERQRFCASAAQRPAGADERGSRALTPAQLPPDVSAFTGRGAELARLDELLEAGESAVPIAVICGLPGVGKTALAVHWARAVRLRFPDGQLYTDLRGFAQQPPLRPVDALGALLRGIGVKPEDIPIDAAEAAALFRSLVSGRRLLIVLDNAHAAAQVRPMLPGDPGCLVLVTSRNGLSGLIARDGAHRVELGVLPPGEAIELLRRTAGHTRIAAEPDAAVALAEACGRLPLALRIVAAHLGERPNQSIGGHVSELRAAPGLAALELHGDADASARAAFALSYQDQPPAVRRMFRLLALAPGPDVGVDVAAALAGAAATDAVRLLEELVSAHLVQRSESDRYGQHDLLRRYSGELVRAEEPDAEPAGGGDGEPVLREREPGPHLGRGGTAEPGRRGMPGEHRGAGAVSVAHRGPAAQLLLDQPGHGGLAHHGTGGDERRGRARGRAGARGRADQPRGGVRNSRAVPRLHRSPSPESGPQPRGRLGRRRGVFARQARDRARRDRRQPVRDGVFQVRPRSEQERWSARR